MAIKRLFGGRDPFFDPEVEQAKGGIKRLLESGAQSAQLKEQQRLAQLPIPEEDLSTKTMTFRPPTRIEERLSRQEAPALHEIHDKAMERYKWLEDYVQATASALAKARVELAAISGVLSQTRVALTTEPVASASPTEFLPAPKEELSPVI